MLYVDAMIVFEECTAARLYIPVGNAMGPQVQYLSELLDTRALTAFEFHGQCAPSRTLRMALMAEGSVHSVSLLMGA